MRKLAIALVALFTLSMVVVSCDNNNEPNAPENRPGWGWIPVPVD